MSRHEPTVRIRSKPDDEAIALAALGRAGYAVERSLTWLVVRDADPDAVNEALVVGGANVRVALREGIGRLVGWLLEREGKLDGRLPNVKTLAKRVLDDGGLDISARYALREDGALLAAAGTVYEELMATGGGFVAWDRFLALFCVEKSGA
jgi:hypothetical protein